MVATLSDQFAKRIPFGRGDFNLIASPIGTVLAYAGPVSESEVDELQDKLAVTNYIKELESKGWLVCDGRPLSKDKYPKLYNAIGISHGAGYDMDSKQIAEFNLPDFRGRFLRGVTHTAANDPDKDIRQSYNGGNSGNRGGWCEWTFGSLW